MALLNPDQISDILQSILDVGCNCLASTPSGVPNDCFISHHIPPSDCCSMLAVWIEDIRPIQGFENAQYISGVKLTGRCGDIGAVIDVAIRLVRPCYPGLIDNPMNPFPDPVDIQAAAENLLVDAWSLRCCIMQAQCAGLLLPSTTDCLEVAWGDMLPYGPEGGCAGWTWHITVEMPPCLYDAT